jgi:TatD DNase family protein
MAFAPFPLFDTHVHLDRPPLQAALGDEVRAAGAAGVQGFVVPGIAPADWSALVETVGRVPGALAAPGVHPLAAADWSGEVAKRLETLLERAVAVGEIGLDGALATPDPSVQERAFRNQLRLAIAMRRPVLIHCRKAIGRVLDILRAEGAQRVGGIFHAFSGSVESAREAVRLNFAIGIGGSITYPNARRVPEVLRQVPEEWLVLETDAPDLAPAPHRGEVNRPAYLPLIAARVAALRGWSAAETAQLTTANALRILGLPALDNGKVIE